MAAPAIEWGQLAPGAQETLSWAVAIERSGPVGTRGLLLGTMRARSADSEADQLLRHFGTSEALLVDGLERARKQVPIEPNPSSPVALDSLPRLTANGAEALQQSARLAEDTGTDGLVDPAHLFGGMLAVPGCTAYRALADLLAPHVQLQAVVETYGEYLRRRDATSFGLVLQARFPRGLPTKEPTSDGDPFFGLDATPTVRSVVGALTGPVTAGAVAAEVLARHREYGDGRARSVRIDRTAGEPAPISDWLARVRRLFPTSPPPRIHGRLLVVALARIDPHLREQLSADGFLTALESEIREPLDTLFVAPREEEAPSPREVALTPSPRQVLTYAAVMLRTRGDAEPDVGTARAAVLLGALHHAVVGSAPTVANTLLETISGGGYPGPTLDRAAGALGAEPLTGPLPRSGPALDVEALASIVAAADDLRKSTGSSRVHLRHLLANVLATTAPTIPDAVFTALGSSPALMRLELRRAVARYVPDEPAEAWDAILADAPDSFDLAGGFSRDAVDPRRGIALEDDHLGVGTYVAMLAAVIADSRTPEPLSIGLFGEWGSGKSYFMGLLREQVDQFSDRGDPYLQSIRQIGFNAWHYADTNIWASLGDEIFEQLAGTEASAEEQRDLLRTEITENLQRRKELRAATARAQEETARLSEALEKASADHQASARALAEAALGSKTLHGQLERAWQRLGVDDQAEQGRLLADEARGTIADVDLLRQAVRGTRGLALVAMAVVALVLAAAAVAAPTLSRWLATGGAATLAALLTTATVFVARVRSGLRTLNGVATDITEKLGDEERQAIEAPLNELRHAEARQRVLQAQHDKVVERVGELARELAELSPGQRLYHFVTERAGSEEYRQHLGLISTVRKDFEQLVALLKDWRERGDAGDAPGRIDRIVLYIDDLDRCSPRQVVEVLQAVHLLLALDLFVVVVGVDPRWLLRSLQSEYDKLLTGDRADSGEAWQASPHDYLEKIFNIPFALPRMSPGGFQSLLQSFTGGRTGDAASDRLTAGRHVPPTPGSEDAAAAGAETSAPDEASDGARALAPRHDTLLPAEEHSEAAAATAGVETIEVRPLTEPELQLLASLAPLVETPREAKRLVNLYRMIRSTRNLRPASRFLGDGGRPGEFEAVVILLGLLSGHARLLEDVLAAPPAEDKKGGLLHRPRKSSWQEFAGGIAPRDAEGSWQNDVIGAIPPADVAHWQRLHAGLVGATGRVTLPDLDAFQFWAPRIARFSFLLSPYVADGAARGASEAPVTPVGAARSTS